MFESIYQPIVELGYSIQMSQFFTAYTIFVFSLGTLLTYMFLRYILITHKLTHEVRNPRATYYSQKLSKREFEMMKLKQTNQEVTSLVNSKAYRSYLMDKHDPHSIINLRSRLLNTQIPDEEVMNDEQDQANSMHQQ